MSTHVVPWIRWSDGPAEALDRLLDRAELSNTELGREMGLSDSTISRYRSGERIPNVERLRYMVARAGGSVDEVLGIGDHAALLMRLKKKIVGEIDAEIQDARGALGADEPERKTER